MTLFTNPFKGKDKSEEIHSEPFFLEKNIEKTEFTAVNMEVLKPTKKMIDWEAFFESLSGPQEMYSWTGLLLVTLNRIISILINIFVCLILRGGRMAEDEEPVPFVDWHILPLMMTVLGCFALIVRPEKYECRQHYYDIDYHILAVTVFIATLFALSIFWLIPYSFFLIIMTILLLTIALNIFVACVNSQKRTKLRFDPREDNSLYTLVRAESKDKGIIRIVESSVFKITLENIGSEPWNSANMKLHRHTGTGKNGKCFCAEIPEFTLLPKGQVDLIPETASYEGECIRLPFIHCFGLRDRYLQVKTFVSYSTFGYAPNKKRDEDQLDCSAYIMKVAEHNATYIEKEWSNFTPC